MPAKPDLARGLDDLLRACRAAVSPQSIDELTKAFAGEASVLIVRRTRSGQGVANDGGAERDLRPLSKSYIEKRKRAKLSAFTSPRKSNLTFTGEMLGSLVPTKRGNGRWVLTFEGRRDDGHTNAEVARYVSGARPFLYLSRDELARLEKSYRRNFASLVKRQLKK